MPLSTLSTLSTLKYMPLSVYEKFFACFSLCFHSVRRFLGTVEIPVTQIPEYSKQLLHSPMFDVLQGIRTACTFMSKTLNHGLTQVILENHAGAYIFSTRGRTLPRHSPLHHLCLYKHPDKPLPFCRTETNQRLRFLGEDLIWFKKTGFPKKGRKRKNSGR